MQERLTNNGILFVSSGFSGPFDLQIIALGKIPHSQKLNMCLSDGDAYFGGIYEYEEIPPISKYSIVRVTVRFFSMEKPMLIENLQIIDNEIEYIVGNTTTPQTLNQYLKREGSRYSDIEEIKALKRTKLNQNLSETGNEKNLIEPLFKNDSESADIIAISSLPDNLQNIEETSSEIQLKSLNVNDTSNHSRPPISNSFTFSSHVAIKDLYGGMIDWKILGKVNFVEHFKCQTGKSALSFLLEDQYGDEIKCTYFPKSNFAGPQSYPIEQGKIYTFSGGDIKMKKNQQRNEDGEEFRIKQLQITFIQSLFPILREEKKFQFQTKRIVMLNELVYKPNHYQVKLVGIIKHFNRKEKRQLDKKNKYQCILCDPLTQHQIEFGLAINEDERKIQQGHIYVLHNFNLIKKEQQIRLSCSNRSYFTEENQNSDQLFQPYRKFLADHSWKTLEYINLSAPPFIPRTILEMKKLTQMSQQSIHSLLQCQIKQVRCQKQYNACKKCNHFVSQKQPGLYYCSKCNKMVDFNQYFTLQVHFQDHSDTLRITTYGKQSESILLMPSDQFSVRKDRQEYLVSLKEKQYAVQIKSEKKNDQIVCLPSKIVQGQKLVEAKIQPKLEQGLQ